MKDPIKVKRGKKSKASGAEFENRVRKDLEEKGWIVDKWSNNIEFGHYEDGIPLTFVSQKYSECVLRDGAQIKHPCGKLIKAKNKWAGPGRPMMMSAGFPDFIAFRRHSDNSNFRFREVEENNMYEAIQLIGVESKSDGYLKPEEKEKCKWYLDNNIFSKILIAKKTKVKNRIVVVYQAFEEKYLKKEVKNAN